MEFYTSLTYEGGVCHTISELASIYRGNEDIQKRIRVLVENKVS